MARRFGIEIEFGFGGSHDEVVQALREAGLNCERSSYSRNNPHGWSIKSDASVRGGECVSPVLDIDNPEHREQVTKAVMALRSVGAYTDPSAGIHVHIDGSGMDHKQVAAVARIFTKFEDCIYRVATSGWETMRPGGRSYCKPLPYETAQKIARAKSLDAVARAYYGASNGSNIAWRQQSHGDSSRYCGLNLHSWFYRKTIEFRVFNSSLNPERIQGYIGMCMAIVQDARNGFTRSINKRYELGGMAAGTTNEKNARHRFLQVLRYDGGMALEDMERLTKIWRDSKPQTRENCGVGAAY